MHSFKPRVFQWSALRGDLSNEYFEKYIYNDQLIESNIGNDLYQSLIEANFKNRNAVADIKNLLYQSYT
jgi:hypothetical protein